MAEFDQTLRGFRWHAVQQHLSISNDPLAAAQANFAEITRRPTLN